MAASVPAIIENHLDSIHSCIDGKIILSSSNLSGRYWNGSLWCFKNVDDAPDVEKCITGISTPSGISDFLYMDPNIAVLGMDSGCLDVFKLEKQSEAEGESFTWIFGACEHDDLISSMALNSNKSNLVTVGADKCVKIWDMETWATTATYRPVHDGRIWQVTCSETDPNIFVTCGQDGKVLLFDLRLPKPARIIATPILKGEPTSVSWKLNSSDIFGVGDESGQVCLIDIRQIASTHSWNPHKRRIVRILFSKYHPWVATCSDDTDVCVSKTDDIPTVIYRDNQHDDYVRGLSWSSKEELVSCAWDTKVLKHNCKETN